MTYLDPVESQGGILMIWCETKNAPQGNESAGQTELLYQHQRQPREFFRSAKPEIKILLLGSIFPRKIEFDGKNYRTRSYNRMLDVIYQETNRLQGQENKKSSDFSEDFNWVPGAGTIP